MKLGRLRPAYLKAAGRDPVGWDAIWNAFVEVIREPLDEPAILYDNVLLEIAPAYPPYSQHDAAILSRRVGLRDTSSYNELEAGFIVSADWRPLGLGSKPMEIAGRGPSSYAHDPAQSVDAFVAEVEQSPAVAELRRADAAFQGWQAVYQRPRELE